MWGLHAVQVVVMLSGLAVALESPKVAKYDLIRRQNAMAGEANLGNIFPVGGGLYTINLTVGTPPQSLLVQLDTGSSDIMLLGPKACGLPTSACNRSYTMGLNAGFYDPFASSTITLGAPNMEIDYADGTRYYGEYYTDTVTVAGMTLTNMTLGLIENATAPGNLPIVSVMGIGYASLEAGYLNGNLPQVPTAVQQMKSQGLISAAAFSLYLNDKEASGGEIIFGGYDMAKFTGNLSTVPILVPSQPSQYPSQYFVPWTSLSFSNSAGNVSIPLNPVAALLDSGTSFISVTPDIANALTTGLLGVTTIANDEYILPCSSTDHQAYFTFGFNGDPNAMINVPLTALLIPYFDASGVQFTDAFGDLLCQVAIRQSSSPAPGVILGEAFMRSAYLIYDIDTAQISMAQANLNATDSNIVAIVSSSGIGAITAASTASVSLNPTATFSLNTAALSTPSGATLTLSSVNPTLRIPSATKGASGTPGASGSAGASGSSGPSGSLGASGSSGATGSVATGSSATATHTSVATVGQAPPAAIAMGMLMLGAVVLLSLSSRSCLLLL